MAKGSNQKLKLMYLFKILMENTDETHSISMSDILLKLKDYGITAERKSIYNDLESLRQLEYKGTEPIIIMWQTVSLNWRS